MSLTRHLSSGRGPVWDWFAANFPETRGVSTVANRQLRIGPEVAIKPPCETASVGPGLRIVTLSSSRAKTERACPLPPPPGSDAALVGTAIGYVLTAALAPESLHDSVALVGARQLDGIARGRELPSVAGEQAIKCLRHLHANDGNVPNKPARTEACQLALLLARCEQWFRAGIAVSDFVQPLLDWSGGDLSELAEALATHPTLTDLEALAQATLEDLRHLSAEEPLHVGPTFAQSVALGGADADIIAAGLLLDLKATSQTRVVGRKELWQLLGYLLADTDNAYGITRVGFAALRWRSMTSWEAHDYMWALGGGARRSLADRRHEFAELLESLAVARRRNRRVRDAFDRH